MQTILISGANRGIGLEFCRQYANAGWQVIATCRQAAKAEALGKLTKLYSNLQGRDLDVGNFMQITALSQTLADISVDILVKGDEVQWDKNARYRLI